MQKVHNTKQQILKFLSDLYGLTKVLMLIEALTTFGSSGTDVDESLKFFISLEFLIVVIFDICNM